MSPSEPGGIYKEIRTSGFVRSYAAKLDANATAASGSGSNRCRNRPGSTYFNFKIEQGGRGRGHRGNWSSTKRPPPVSPKPKRSHCGGYQGSVTNPAKNNNKTAALGKSGASPASPTTISKATPGSNNDSTAENSSESPTTVGTPSPSALSKKDLTKDNKTPVEGVPSSPSKVAPEDIFNPSHRSPATTASAGESTAAASRTAEQPEAQAERQPAVAASLPSTAPAPESNQGRQRSWVLRRNLYQSGLVHDPNWAQLQKTADEARARAAAAASQRENEAKAKKEDEAKKVGGSAPKTVKDERSSSESETDERISSESEKDERSSSESEEETRTCSKISFCDTITVYEDDIAGLHYSGFPSDDETEGSVDEADTDTDSSDGEEMSYTVNPPSDEEADVDSESTGEGEMVTDF